jgi:hypothetical protein
MICTVVVLPAPLGPSSEKSFPRRPPGRCRQGLAQPGGRDRAGHASPFAITAARQPRPRRRCTQRDSSRFHGGFIRWLGCSAIRTARIVAHARCLIPGLWQADATGPATRRLAGSGAVRLEAFGPVRVTAAVEDDAERVALQLVERPHPRPVRGARPRRAGRRASPTTTPRRCDAHDGDRPDVLLHPPSHSSPSRSPARSRIGVSNAHHAWDQDTQPCLTPSTNAQSWSICAQSSPDRAVPRAMRNRRSARISPVNDHVIDHFA